MFGFAKNSAVVCVEVAYQQTTTSWSSSYVSLYYGTQQANPRAIVGSENNRAISLSWLC